MQAFRLRYVVVLWVVSVVVVGYGVFWVTQTNYVHGQWASMYRQAQHLRFHLYDAGFLLNNTTIHTNRTAQTWFSEELSSARDNLYELSTPLDEGHWRQFQRIEDMINDVRSFWSVFVLNSSVRISVVRSMRNVGDKVVAAYAIGGDYIRGPPLWYFGPSPPNEALLEEASQLADDVRATILDLRTVHLPTQP